MANWKRPTEELPKDNEVVIIVDDSGYNYLVEYNSSRKYGLNWEECGAGSIDFRDSEIKAWCRVPEYDLKDE